MTLVRTVGSCHHDCPDTCGWIATSDDGVLVEMRGNPDHPYSRGELCPKVNRFVHRVNSDDRILTPLIRTGPKGAGEFRAATWDEALTLTAERTSAARVIHGGETILPWHSAGTQGLIQESSLDQALFATLGASHQTGSICGAATAAGMAATYGDRHGGDPLNLVHAELIVLWGTNTRLTNRHLWPFVEQARERGAQIVVIDPMRTITADAADWFIQPLPGTDVALMLAVMHVIIAEGLVDRDYVEAHTEGFDELAAHVSPHTPQWAELECGVDAEEIRRFARAYATAQPAFIRALIGAEHHEMGAAFYRTVAMLPLLTGSWRHLGGGIARSCGSIQEIDDVRPGVFSVAGSGRGLPQPQLGRHLTALDDPPITVLYVWCGNPLVSLPNAAELRRGLERDDLFTVVSEQFLTDTARYADVIFPACTQVENLDVVASWGHLWLGWNEPAIEPRGESVSNTELWRRLAGTMGIDHEVFSRSDEELIRMALGPEVDIDELRSTGFVRISDTDDYLPYAEGGFHTTSGKALFVNDAMVALGQDRLPTYRPSQEGPTSERAAAYPLMLVTPKKQLRFLNTSYSQLPGHGDRENGPFVELDAADAAARGLSEGDRARVHNGRGSLTLPVSISDRLRPGLVSVPWGWWAEAYDNDGIVVNDLTNDTPTDWGGGAAYGDTLVEVTPA